MDPAILRCCLVALTLAQAPVAFAAGDAATEFHLFVPPNNDATGRDVLLMVTAVSEDTSVEIRDDAADGDDDDSVTTSLSRGQTYVVRLADGGVNDDAGGKWDGDLFHIFSSAPVVVQIATRSNWQHDWAASEDHDGRGTSFFLYAPGTSGADNDIDVFAYEDDTQVSIVDISASTHDGTSGATAIDLEEATLVLEATLQLGEDLNVRRGLGIDILDPGRTYWVRATKPVTVQYGHLDQVTGGNQARDGGGFVPSVNGSATGPLFFFTIPTNPGLQHEKELRVVCYQDGTTVTLRGANRHDADWTLVDQSIVNAGGHLDFVGATDPAFAALDLYRLEVTPAHHRCTVFEANWLETGAMGTSDIASAMSSANGRPVGRWFVPYIGPPGYQHNASGVGGTYSHLYVATRHPGTEITVTDLDGAGAVVNDVHAVPEDGYVDVRIDSTTYGELTAHGRRPYLEVRSNNPVSILSGNFNDNFMAFVHSTVEPEPVLEASIGSADLECGQSTTLSYDCTTNLSAGLADFFVEVEVPSTVTILSATPTGGSGTPHRWDQGNIGAGSGQSGTVELRVDCGPGCPDDLAAAVTVRCGGTHDGVDLFDTVTLPLSLRGAGVAALDSFTAVDDETGGGPVALSWELVGGSGPTTVTLSRASGPDTTGTVLDTSVRSPGVTPDADGFNDATVVGGQTYYYRLTTTESGCSETHGPLAVFVGSGASSGLTGGLESDGRLASHLARRAVARHPTDWLTPEAYESLRVQDGVQRRAISMFTDLGEILPERGPFDAAPLLVTPADLPAVTNARNVFGVDYVDAQGNRVGSLLLLETYGAPYDHSKALCDRAGGATLTAIDALPSASGTVLRPSLDHGQATDHAVELRFVEDPAGHVVAHDVWLAEDMPTLTPDQRVITVQAWSARPGVELSLAEAVAERLGATWAAPGAAPPAYFNYVSTLGGRLDFALTGDLTGLTLHAQGRHTDGTLFDRQANPDLDLGPLPEFLDITLLLRDPDGRTVDRVWTADGAWTGYDDSLWGGDSVVLDFDDRCDRARPRQGDLRLAGCASIRVDVAERAGVARHLGGGAAPLDLTQMTQMRFDLLSDAPVEVCMHGAQGRQRCAPATGTAVEASAFRGRAGSCGGLSDVELITFTTTRPGDAQIVVRDLAFDLGSPVSDCAALVPATASLVTGLARPAPAGCSVGGRPSPAPLLLVSLVLSFVARRRKEV